MREVIRPHQYYPWTDLLDPHGDKPYLVLDSAGKYHVLYWKATFKKGKWVGSDFFDEPNADDNTRSTRVIKGFACKVFELPMVGSKPIHYDPPKIYSSYDHQRLNQTA